MDLPCVVAPSVDPAESSTRALPDSMTVEWNTTAIQAAIAPFIHRWDIGAASLELAFRSRLTVKQIISFDEYGVSGHTNHRAIARALEEAIDWPVLYQLKSASVLAKYSSIFTIPLSLLLDRQSSQTSIKILSSPRAYMIAIRAFARHPSQTKWFRGLYCLFSRYLWWNELVPYNAVEVEGKVDRSEL